MRIISEKTFRKACIRYPKYEQQIMSTCRILKQGQFPKSADLKKVFPSLDRFVYQKGWWLIDIAGKKLRLVAGINFPHQVMFVKIIGNHEEYDGFTDNHR